MQFWEFVEKPTLVLDKSKAVNNLKRLSQKAAKNNLTFRPHFKTHQSAVIGEWFHGVGVSSITVSSVEMAVYFANHGWHDITIAFPVNLRQLSTINDLAQRITLNVLLDSERVAQQLSKAVSAQINVWLEIEAGYQRTGLPWRDLENITAVSQTITQSPHLTLVGVLTHAGNTYKARGKTAVLNTHNQTITRLKSVQTHLKNQGIKTAISIGDTPACTLAKHFEGIDEIRPGNFIFYDVMQAEIGSCQMEDIAVAVACPIVGIYPEQQKIAIYGGAIHHSKEGLKREDGSVSYGRIALPTPNGWQITPATNHLFSLSQEHGLIRATPDLISNLQVGDLLYVLPIHSCLTANLLKRYLTLNGEWIEMARI